MATATQALSKNDLYQFLKGSNEAENTQLTPLEQAQNTVQSFASYTTGTIEMKITPELMEAVSGLRQMNIGTEFRKLAQFVSTLQAGFPCQDGLFVVMINPSWLASHVPFCETPQDVTDDMLKKSQWNLVLSGEHALIDGVPVWDRLDGERYDFFLLFKLYRDARYGLIDSGDYVFCTRSMAGLARRLNISPLLVSTIANIYSWSLRCAYYDKFFEMEIMRRKQMEVQLLQRDHLKFSVSMLDKAMDYLDKNMKAFTPRDAIALAELGFKFSRLSLGLSPDKLGSANDQAGQPLLAIQFNQNNQNKTLQVNDQRSYGSEVERRLQDDLKDNTNLLSILTVLQKSGAMATALNDGLMPNESESMGLSQTIIKADPSTKPVSSYTTSPIIIEPDVSVPSGFEEEV